MFNASPEFSMACPKVIVTLILSSVFKSSLCITFTNISMIPILPSSSALSAIKFRKEMIKRSKLKPTQYMSSFPIPKDSLQ